ncbi:MAG: ribosome silencing factor [Candidatus Neomarinimicrobiota bacterium]
MNKSKLDNNSSQSLLKEIVQLAFEKKAQNLISLDLRGLSYLSDYFIICHGKSEPQVKAIVDNIRKGTSFKPRHLEGYENKKWVLLDYFNIIVHVFDEEERDYYSIENIWADAPKNEFNDEKT